MAATVDVAPFTDEAAADAAVLHSTADRWDATFREVGFARIVGHGVPAELVAELRAATRAFFFKPDVEKMRYHRPATTHARSAGSFVPLWSSLAQGGHDDPLEGYTFHRPRDGWLHLDDPALDHPPEIAAVAARYGHALEEVSHTLHRLSAAALQLPPDYFDTPAGTCPASLLVLSHYPPLSDVWARDPEKPRYRAHSDYTGFTLLLQDETDHGGPSADAAEAEADGGGGLEIDIEGRWTPVSPRPDSFIVNIGDLFELWTNKRWRSTPHRVASPRPGSAAAARSRVTAMLFTGPSLETIVQPAPTCGAPLFPTMTAREHLTAMATSQSKESQYKAKEAAARAAASGGADAGAPQQGHRPPRLTASQQAAGLALPVAAEAGHLECTELLLAAGVSREAMVAALLCAERMGRVACAAVLRRALEQDLAPQEQQGGEAAQVASAAGEAAAPAVPKEDAPNDAEQHAQVGGDAPGSPMS